MRTFSSRLYAIAPCLFALLLIGGCFGRSGDSPELAEVTGTVTVNGKPVPNITVTFYPEAGGHASRGSTDADGKFCAMYDRDMAGVLPWVHEVKFMLMDADAAVNLPRKFADQSTGMKAEIALEGPNDFSFDLKGK